MKKTIRDYDLTNKKVIIRVDFNVPIKDGVITDDNRIKESLKTINYAIEGGAKVILLSHLGRVKTLEYKEKNTLKPVSVRLSELLGKEVKFIPTTRGEELEIAIQNMESGDVILVENTRYEDLEGKKESSNDLELAKYWASLGDIYINDAFGTSHRAHASNVGIASILPNGIGFLIEKELENLEEAINNPERPFTVILGGSKVSDKISVIENIVTKADNILIGGGMAFTFLKASGVNIGSSLLDSENLEFAQTMLEKYPNKIILPIDVVIFPGILTPIFLCIASRYFSPTAVIELLTISFCSSKAVANPSISFINSCFLSSDKPSILLILSINSFNVLLVSSHLVLITSIVLADNSHLFTNSFI